METGSKRHNVIIIALTTQSGQLLMLVSLSWNNTEVMVGDTIGGEAIGTKKDN